MRLNTTISTAPTFEPITTAVAKSHCRVYHTLDDTYIGDGSVGSGIITAARQTIENLIGSPIPNTTFTTVWDSFPSGNELELPRSPLVSITSLTYVDTAGNTQTLSASTDYTSHSYNGVGRIQLRQGISWPSLYDGALGVVTAVYVAGYGANIAAIPLSLRQLILLQIQNLYEMRSPLSAGQLYEVPRVVSDLVRQFSTGDYR